MDNKTLGEAALALKVARVAALLVYLSLQPSFHKKCATSAITLLPYFSLHGRK